MLCYIISYYIRLKGGRVVFDGYANHRIYAKDCST